MDGLGVIALYGGGLGLGDMCVNEGEWMIYSSALGSNLQIVVLDRSDRIRRR